MKLLAMELLLCTLLCQTANIVISNTMLDDSMDDEMLYEVPSVPEEIISIIPERGSCECGLFHTTTPTDEDIPIITKAFDVQCNIFGGKDCIQRCTVLAIVINDSIPELLCSAFGDFGHIRAFVHSRVCGSPFWIFTHYVSPYDICCEEYTVVDC